MADLLPTTRIRFWLSLVRLIGIIVPQRLRADWRQEWEAELCYREALLAEWDKLDTKHKFDLLRRALGAFADALLLQPRRMEDEMFQDIRFGVRMLLRKPGLLLAAVLCLALGTGANGLIFSLVNAMLLRPVSGLSAPEELTVMLSRNEQNEFGLTSYPDFQDYETRAQSFSGLLAYRALMLNVGGDGFTERLQGAIASSNYFTVLGVGTALGRTFRDDEVQGVVISHGYWQRRFAADATIIGKTVNINSQPFTIIGIAPPEFVGTETGELFDLWLPLAAQPQVMPGDRLRRRDNHWLLMIGRRNTEVSATRAQEELDLLAAQWRQAYPNEHRGMTGLHLSPHVGLGPVDYPIVARFLGTVLAVVGLVLLIACANVANLLLVRAAARRKEIAVRLALGATRLRIVRQILTESLMLALAGTGLGLLIPWLTKDWLLSLFLPLSPGALNFQPDARVIAFTVLLALATALLFGLVPALQASKPDVVPELKDAAMTRSRRQGRLSSAFIVAQIAITMTLLVGAGLLLRTMQRFAAIDPGFATDSVLALSFDLKSLGYNETKGQQLYQQLTARVAALPGVEAASLAAVMPLGWGSPEQPVFIDEFAPPVPDRPLRVDRNVVTPNWFRTMNIALLSGRDFTAQDNNDAPGVVIVNEAMARRFWPHQNPLGRHFEIGEQPRRTVEIIGVVRNSKHRNLDEAPQPVLYLPLRQQYEASMILHLRSRIEPLSLVAAVRREVQQLDANLPLFEIKTLAQRLNESIWPQRTMTKLVGLFGLLALLLAVIGLYGVLSYTVTQRTRELGIRRALGAQARDVLTLILRQGMRLVLLGVALGLIAAVGLTRVLANFLSGLSATDPLTFGLAALVLLAVGVLACYLPARRATKTDPMIALRHE
jgi:predicted permease